MHIVNRILPLAALLVSLIASPVLFADTDYNVRIVRDHYGVPHIYGESYAALWYGVGYAQAQDRMWQADLLRRTVEGRMSELMGSSSIAGDIFARTVFGTNEDRATMLAASSETNQLQFQAYTDGFNAWRQEAIDSGKLPIEYLANGLIPEPWTTNDSVAVVQLIFLQFGQEGADELTNALQLQSLSQRYGPEDGYKIFLDTHWLNDADAYTSIPASGRTAGSSTQRKTRIPKNHYHDDQRYEEIKKGWKHNLRHLGIKNKAASNAIVISPKLSANGHALLLGGPQMGYSVPQIALEMSIHNDSLNVHGISFAGIPGIAIGVTHQFSWSFTSGVSDNADIYADPLSQLTCRVETIQVRGADPATTPVCKTLHGPAIALNPAGGIAFTLKSAVRGYEVQSFEAIQKAQYARNLEQIDTHMRHWAPNFNMLIADVDGNIAYRHLGRLPLRSPGDNPWMPHDGNGSSEWTGFVSWEDLPKATNPHQGWLVNWNNKPSSDWNNSSLKLGSFGPIQRVDALVSQMEPLQAGTVTTDTLAQINRTAAFTTQSPSDNSIAVFVPKLLGLMTTQVDTTADPRLAAVVRHLQGWNRLQLDLDNNGYYDDPAVAIFNTWFETFSVNTFADELASLYEPSLVANLTYRLITTEPALPLNYNYLGSSSVSTALTEALISSLDNLEIKYGSSDMGQWLQAAAQLHWTQQGAAGVPDTPWMNRGTYNQIVSMGKGSELYGYNVVAPGQSGDPYSPNFADQLGLFASMTYKPMLLSRRQQMQNKQSVTKLSYENN